MSINLLEKVQQNLHYPPVLKIDPTTQQVNDDISGLGEDRFSQVAIPGVLTGLYKFSATDEGAKEILNGDFTTNWVDKIFDESNKQVIEDIAITLNRSKEVAVEQMNGIADEAIKLVHENLPEGATEKDVMQFFSNQVNNFLPFLPASLHMGNALNDTSLDDNTHKMQGPISSLMHSIGNAFSTPETKDDTNHAQ